MPSGGARPGAGRPKGSKTRVRDDAATSSPPAPYRPVINGISPLDFLLSVMQAPDAPFAYRLEAAKLAAPYVHPKIAAAKPAAPEEKPEAPIGDFAEWEKALEHRAN